MSEINTITKLAAMERGSANINRLIIDNLRSYSDLNIAVQSFLSNPVDETASELDACFANCESGFESVRAAVNSVAMIAMDTEITDDGAMKISGVVEEDGIRLG